MSTDSKKTIGQAIDQIVVALEGLPEGARLTALRAASDHLGVQFVAALGSPRQLVAQPAYVAQPSAAATTLPAHDIRSLKEIKQPANSQEMAALVAYYLQSLAPAGDQKQEISAADLDKYFKQASFPLPRRIDQVLIDAKAAGYFDGVSRGIYKLNPVGYNLVVHTLPRSGASSKGPAARKKGTSRSKKTNRRKK